MNEYNILKYGMAAIAIVIASFYIACRPYDKCNGIVCTNSGVCREGACTCLAAYNGTYCQGINLVGLWTGRDSVYTSYEQSISIVQDTAGNVVYITFLNAPLGRKTIKGTLDAGRTMITFDKQVINEATRPDTLSGVIQLISATQVVNNYTYTIPNSGTTNIKGRYTKQQ